MKNSKVVLFALSFGALMLVSWVMPEKAASNDIIINDLPTEVVSSVATEALISDCFADENCYDAADIDYILDKIINVCWGYPVQTNFPGCACVDLNGDGRVNVRDIVELNNNICD